MTQQKIKKYSMYVRLIGVKSWTMTHTATVDTLDEVTERIAEYLTCSNCPRHVDCLTFGTCQLVSVTAIYENHQGRDLKIVVNGESIEYRF